LANSFAESPIRATIRNNSVSIRNMRHGKLYDELSLN